MDYMVLLAATLVFSIFVAVLAVVGAGFALHRRQMKAAERFLKIVFIAGAVAMFIALMVTLTSIGG